MKSSIHPSQNTVDYLRISITDRCNLRCIYCMPPEGIVPSSHDSILSYEEICELVSAAVQCGIRKVRITGGEPLVRKNVIGFIQALSRIGGLEEISMTTNGVLLGEFATELKSAGMKRINISLDTLNKERFGVITRRKDLPAVWRGIDTVLQLGFEPVKLNVVAMKGLNDDEIPEFGRLTLNRPLHVRFIEFMSIGRMKPADERYFLPAHIVQEKLESVGELTPVQSVQGNGPARYFSYPGAQGTVGLISPLTNGFCQTCNRLRLTADGRLRPCLLSDVEINVKDILRSGAGPEAIENLFLQAMSLKTYGNNLKRSHKRYMSSIGG